VPPRNDRFGQKWQRSEVPLLQIEQLGCAKANNHYGEPRERWECRNRGRGALSGLARGALTAFDPMYAYSKLQQSQRIVKSKESASLEPLSSSELTPKQSGGKEYIPLGRSEASHVALNLPARRSSAINSAASSPSKLWTLSVTHPPCGRAMSIVVPGLKRLG